MPPRERITLNDSKTAFLAEIMERKKQKIMNKIAKFVLYHQKSQRYSRNVCATFFGDCIDNSGTIVYNI